MNSQRNISMLVGLAVALSLAWGVSAAQPGATSKPADKSVEEVLNTPVKSISFDNIPLEEVIGFFRDVSGLNIVTRWPDLMASGIEKSAPVTVKLTNLPLGRALDATLDTLRTGQGGKLGYAVQDDILVISTAEDLNRTGLVTKVYDVSDLIDCADPEQAESLKQVIKDHIQPETWAPTGNIGNISHFKGLLTVTHTSRVQSAVKKLLDDLRKAGPKVSRSPSAQTKQAELRVKLVGNMKETCFDPLAIGIIAVGGLRTEVSQKPEELAQQLESILPETKSLGLRNAIRLTLKDLYVEMGSAAKAQEQFKAMIKENDDALQKTPKDAAPGAPAGAGGKAS